MHLWPRDIQHHLYSRWKNKIQPIEFKLHKYWWKTSSMVYYEVKHSKIEWKSGKKMCF